MRAQESSPEPGDEWKLTGCEFYLTKNTDPTKPPKHQLYVKYSAVARNRELRGEHLIKFKDGRDLRAEPSGTKRIDVPPENVSISLLDSDPTFVLRVQYPLGGVKEFVLLRGAAGKTQLLSRAKLGFASDAEGDTFYAVFSVKKGSRQSELFVPDSSDELWYVTR